ncbi:MAG TPA: hypothetical protein VNP03_14800 [Pseudonocardia sp.]|nr:hypothetical protein [Pseudonocardia sp.]
MRAVVLDGPGGVEALRIREVPLLEPAPGWDATPRGWTRCVSSASTTRCWTTASSPARSARSIRTACTARWSPSARTCSPTPCAPQRCTARGAVGWRVDGLGGWSGVRGFRSSNFELDAATGNGREHQLPRLFVP